jgi:dihydroflavonol-4-reductase
MLTGATGFVGGALLRELLARGWEVRILVRPGSQRTNLKGIPESFEVANGDLRDRESLRRAMDGCDHVFHVAARYSLWNPDPLEIYRDNVDGTRNVLEVAAKAGVERVVYTSTVGVLRAPDNGQPADESSLAEVDDIHGHYKRTKWYAEECARQMADGGLPVIIVNPSTPVGPHDVKPTPTGRIIVNFLRGLMPAYTDTGLNIVPVEDVARGHILAAERGKPGRCYILGGENMSLRRLLEVLAGLTSRKPPRIAFPPGLLVPMAIVSEAVSRVTHRPPWVSWEAIQMARKHMFFDSSRARQELGYEPTDATLALERAVRWFQENGYVNGKAPAPVA